MDVEILKEVVSSPWLLEIGRKAVEDVLVDRRDNRLSVLNRGNGLVIREKDGKESCIIRMGTGDAMRIGIEAIIESFEKENNK